MAWLIFFFYLLVFCWLVTRITFIKRSGLSNKLLVGLFVVKVLGGIAYFYLLSQPQYKQRSDTWKYYEASLTEKKMLLQDPVSFFGDFFVSDYTMGGGLFSDSNSYWNDVKDTIMIKMLAVANLFTFDNYYADIVLFNFLFFFGLVAFYRLMKTLFPERRYGMILAIFLIPSFLFWCSGIHKDGLIFSCLGLILYHFHFVLQRKKMFPRIFLILFCLMLIFMLRNYLVFLLVPSLFTGWLLHYFPRRKWITLSLVTLLGLAFFFFAKYVHPALNLPAYVAGKQEQFRKLDGNSVVNLNPLHPDMKSFVSNLPAAIDMGFFRPHPNEKGLTSLVASIEIIFFWLIVIACIVWGNRRFQFPPVILAVFIFSFLTILVIGYTVPFSGAVVRYRSMLLPLILAPVIGNLAGSNHMIKKYM